MGAQIINATSVKKLEDIRSAIAEVDTQLFRQSEDLKERGLVTQAAQGPDKASAAMDQLNDAINSKKAALRNKTILHSTYERQCRLEVRVAETAAQLSDARVIYMDDSQPATSVK